MPVVNHEDYGNCIKPLFCSYNTKQKIILEVLYEVLRGTVCFN